MAEINHTPPTNDTHFLVTGGGKGITAECAVALAKKFQSRFTLIGSSELLDSEPAWSVAVQDQEQLKSAAIAYYRDRGQNPTPREVGQAVKRVLSNREIRQTLSRISSAGGSAAYIQTDITRPEQLKTNLGEILPSVTALVHGAGALADKLIEDKTEADFDLVYGVKVSGLINLLKIIALDRLNYIVLFSSVAGFYGNAGQADYSLSNEILNKLAFHLKFRYPSCQVLSLNWGPWDGGMVTPQLKRILTRKNVALIPPAEGTAALLDLLSKPQEKPQYIIGAPLPFPPPKHDPEQKNYPVKRILKVEDNPFLADHVIGGSPVLPTVCAVAWFVNTCTGLYPGTQFHSLRDYQVFKGIVFDNSSAPEYLLELQELEKENQELVLEGRISSEDNSGKKRFHYQAQIKLTRSAPVRPQIDSFNLTEDGAIPGEDLYHSRTLFHGRAFQGIQRVLNISPAGLTTECLLPPIPKGFLGQFSGDNFNPLLADVHLQSLLIWSHHYLDLVGLPLKIANAVQYLTPPSGTTTYASLRVVSTASHKLIADVTSHDREGTIFTEVRGAEITLNEKLYDLFKQNQLSKAAL